MVGTGRHSAARTDLDRRRAFTLLEMLVAIGIIALLLALLFPVLIKARESAKLVKCTSNIRQIVILLQIYAQRNNGRLPCQATDTQDWSGSLAAMTPGQPVFACPADVNPRFAVPGANDIRSYGVNCGPFTPGGAGMRAPWPVDRFASAARLEHVRHHVFLIGDNHGQFAYSGAWVGVAQAEGLDGIAWGAHRIKKKRGDNYGFADAHVEYRIKAELDWFLVDPASFEGELQDPWKWR